MKRKIIITISIAAVILLGALAASVYVGIIQINNPSKEQYPIRGVDVSSYQGEIDWSILSQQDIDFAFIKATEGSSYTDEYFYKNWDMAAQTELRVGAYHFFSFESTGKAQAENFCNAVTPTENMLPPVVDAEPYGEYDLNNSDKAAITKELTDWLIIVEKKYGVCPIIYTTEQYYNEWIGEAFPQYDIWIRSVYGKPAKDIGWKFWQYSNRIRLKGYNGEEKYIDMNLFSGTAEEFYDYGKQKAR